MNNNTTVTVEKTVKLTKKLAYLVLSIILPAEATREDVSNMADRIGDIHAGFYAKAMEKTNQIITTNGNFSEEEEAEINKYGELSVDCLINLFEGRPWMTDFIRSIRWCFGPLGLRLLKSIVTLDYIREIRTMVQEHLKSKEQELDSLSEKIEKYYSAAPTDLKLTYTTAADTDAE